MILIIRHHHKFLRQTISNSLAIGNLHKSQSQITDKLNKADNHLKSISQIIYNLKLINLILGPLSPATGNLLKFHSRITDSLLLKLMSQITDNLLKSSNQITDKQNKADNHHKITENPLISKTITIG